MDEKKNRTGVFLILLFSFSFPGFFFYKEKAELYIQKTNVTFSIVFRPGKKKQKSDVDRVYFLANCPEGPPFLSYFRVNLM